MNSEIVKTPRGHILKYLIYLGLFLIEGSSTLLQYSCLENPMDGGAWWAAVHGVPKSWTRLSNFSFTFHFHALEKEMATHSSVFAWRIPGMGEPGGLPSMALHRVGHDWSDLAAAAAFFIVQLSHPYVTTGKTIALTRWTCTGSSVSQKSLSSLSVYAPFRWYTCSLRKSAM